MRQLFKTKTVSNFGDIPIGLFKQDLGFLYQSAGYVLGGSFAGVFFQYFIEVIAVDG